MPDPVERFRKLTGTTRPRYAVKSHHPVPPREWVLVGVLLANVAWLTFALGGVRLWGELTALSLALGSLLLLPLWNKGEYPGHGTPVFRLLRCPLFWLGLGLYTYMFIQSWNLAWDWTLEPDARPKLVATNPLVAWLPTGISSPLDESNPVRAMIFYAIPWISCSAMWAGLMTRRSVRLLLHGLAWLGVFFALIALYQHFLDKELILGIFQTVPSKQNHSMPFWGTLINENHAAFYLILGTGLSFGLFLSGWHQDLRKFRKRGGAWMLYLGCSLLTTFAVLMAQARGAIVCVILLWVLILMICSIIFIRRFGYYGAILPAAILIMAITLALSFVINPQVYERQKEEWIRIFDLVQNPELESRYYMMQISMDMIADHPWMGQGAGSFRYLHLPKLADYPEFRTQYYRWKTNRYTGEREKRLQTIWFQNAHVDLLEYLIEWGILGCLFPVLAVGWLLYRAARSRLNLDPGKLVILVSLFIVFLGAAFEFHFRIPLVLLAWCLALATTVKLAELNLPRKGTS